MRYPSTQGPRFTRLSYWSVLVATQHSTRAPLYGHLQIAPGMTSYDRYSDATTINK